MGRWFYVYTHRRKSDGSIFYVGKGQRQRAKVIHNRSKHWQAIVAKNGYSIHFVAKGLPSACACTLERIVIASVGRGKLCNHSDGGEGLSNPSDEVRQKMRAAALGRPGFWTGKKRDAETRNKISLKVSGEKHPRYGIKGPLNPLFGRKQSDEHKAKIGKASAARIWKEESREKLSQKKSGPNHHLYDHRKSTLENLDTGEVFCGTKFFFKQKTGFRQSQIRDLCNGIRKSPLRGWVLKEMERERKVA